MRFHVQIKKYLFVKKITNKTSLSLEFGISLFLATKTRRHKEFTKKYTKPNQINLVHPRLRRAG